MSKSIRLTGLNETLGRIRQLGDDADGAMLHTIEDLTTETHRLAIDNIKPGTGPAAPGEFPHEQTGELKRAIGYELPTKENPVGFVGTAWNLGRWLEIGTKKMRARPWLLPSFKQANRGVAAKLKAAFMERL